MTPDPPPRRAGGGGTGGGGAGVARAYRIAGLLAAVTGQDVRLARIPAGYRLTLAAPADPLIQGALLPVLGATARWGYASRTGLWCEVDG